MKHFPDFRRRSAGTSQGREMIVTWVATSSLPPAYEEKEVGRLNQHDRPTTQSTLPSAIHIDESRGEFRKSAAATFQFFWHCCRCFFLLLLKTYLAEGCHRLDFAFNSRQSSWLSNKKKECWLDIYWHCTCNFRGLVRDGELLIHQINNYQGDSVK